MEWTDEEILKSLNALGITKTATAMRRRISAVSEHAKRLGYVARRGRHPSPENQARDAQIRVLRRAHTVSAIAKKFGISSGRVKQILRKT